MRGRRTSGAISTAIVLYEFARHVLERAQNRHQHFTISEARAGLEVALVEVKSLFEVERDIAPRPDVTQLESDLLQAVRLRLAARQH